MPDRYEDNCSIHSQMGNGAPHNKVYILKISQDSHVNEYPNPQIFTLVK